MKVQSTVGRITGRSYVRAVVATVALIVIVFSGTVLADDDNDRIHINLASRAGAPKASGDAWLTFDEGVLSGRVIAQRLPPQPFGSGRFYGVWFVRTDTNDKAFLGALIRRRSIILQAGGRGETEFRATHFTDGPGTGHPITPGPQGKNLIIVLIENNIDGRKPAPVGEAVAGTF